LGLPRANTYRRRDSGCFLKRRAKASRGLLRRNTTPHDFSEGLTAVPGLIVPDPRPAYTWRERPQPLRRRRGRRPSGGGVRVVVVRRGGGCRRGGLGGGWSGVTFLKPSPELPHCLREDRERPRRPRRNSRMDPCSQGLPRRVPLAAPRGIDPAPLEDGKKHPREQLRHRAERVERHLAAWAWPAWAGLSRARMGLGKGGGGGGRAGRGACGPGS